MPELLFFICVISFLVWCCAPAFFGLESDFTKFTEIYPNRYKQLIVIFLHGPFVMVIFGWCWIGTNAFRQSEPLLNFRRWLRK